MKQIALALALFVVLPRAVADEARFNPPLRGAYLGLRITKNDAGFSVDEVRSGTAAERAGLRVGDVIVRLGRRADLGSVTLESFIDLVKRLPAGTAQKLDVRRGAETLRLEIVPDPLLVRDALALADALENHRLIRALPDAATLLASLENELADAVRRSRFQQEAYEALNDALGRFKISHLAVIPPWTYKSFLGGGQRGEKTYHLGLTLQQRAHGETPAYYIHDVMHGGPAERAGLRVGDEIISVNGVRVPHSPRRTLAGYEAPWRMYTIQVDRGESVTVTYQRRRDGNTVRAALKADVGLNSLEATKNSVRLLATDAGSLGYIHFWDLLASELVPFVRKCLGEQLESAVALLIDLRGRGGKVPVLMRIADLLQKDGRPVALLLDAQTRSAKEILAFRLQGKPKFVLVGETSAGAVRAATYLRLPSGLRVMVPVRTLRPVLGLTRGVDLEGRGVVPDRWVTFELPYAAGEDPILAAGVEALLGRLKKPRRIRL